jgi:hypothetical protein
MTEEEIKRHLAICCYAMMSSIMAVGKPEDSLGKLASEIHRLRAELDEMTMERGLWIDRCTCCGGDSIRQRAAEEMKGGG